MMMFYILGQCLMFGLKFNVDVLVTNVTEVEFTNVRLASYLSVFKSDTPSL